MELSPFILSFELALITTCILLLACIPLAWWLAATRFRFRSFIEAGLSLPIVLPPSVIGFYLLLALSPEGWFGSWVENTFGMRLVFSFPGLVIASVIYSLPFMVHPLLSGFRNIPAGYQEAASLMGKSKTQTLFRVLLPNMKPALLTGIVLSFAHTLGEFGVALMVGGNLSGKTHVASIAVYDEFEAQHFAIAHRYSLVLLVVSFSILLLVYSLNAKNARKPF